MRDAVYSSGCQFRFSPDFLDKRFFFASTWSAEEIVEAFVEVRKYGAILAP